MKKVFGLWRVNPMYGVLTCSPMAEELHSNVRYVDFYGDKNITKASSCHPDANGMTYMADRIYNQVGAWLND